MYLLRRSAFKALSATSISSIAKPRSVATAATRLTLRPTQRWIVAPYQRRFAADDAAPPSAAKTTDETVPEPPSKSEQETIAESSAAKAAEQPSEQTTSASEAAAEPATQQVATEAAPSSSDAFATSQSAQAASAGAGVAPLAAATSPYPNRVMPGVPNPILYVGNLYFEVNEEALKAQFEPLGRIKSVKVVYDHRGLSKGFGYVEFETIDEASKAVETMNQTVFQGRRMAVQFHRPRERSTFQRPRQPMEPTATLFIGNMSYDMSDRDLNDLFREVKNVTDVRVAIDRRTGQPRGFAHADFIDIESATRAMELLKEKEIYGRRLRIDYSKSTATNRQPRNQGPIQ